MAQCGFTSAATLPPSRRRRRRLYHLCKKVDNLIACSYHYCSAGAVGHHHWSTYYVIHRQPPPPPPRMLVGRRGWFMLPNIHRDDDGKQWRRQLWRRGSASAAASVYAVNSLNCWVMKCQKPKCYSHSIFTTAACSG